MTRTTIIIELSLSPQSRPLAMRQQMLDICASMSCPVTGFKMDLHDGKSEREAEKVRPKRDEMAPGGAKGGDEQIEAQREVKVQADEIETKRKDDEAKRERLGDYAPGGRMQNVMPPVGLEDDDHE